MFGDMPIGFLVYQVACLTAGVLLIARSRRSREYQCLAGAVLAFWLAFQVW